MDALSRGVIYVVVGAVGLVVGGPVGAGLSLVVLGGLRLMRLRPNMQPVRPLLLVLLVELKAGRSVLGGLQETARVFPENSELVRSVRRASVGGLPAASVSARPPIDVLFSQLARCQRSGAPAADFVKALIEADIASERNRRMEKARGLPVRLMIPIALLILPGLVLLLYAPALIATWRDLAAPLT